ncbi:MAG: F0F1 ATP synthase subunit A [Oscillospiraceae bacterium]|nr:F0F1 ATP synthase subunit A [Oscillospiraceae bacterium]
MDFNIRNFGVVNIGGIEVWVTETLVNTWMIMAVLVAFAIIVRVKIKKWTEVPEGKFQNTVEAIVETFDNFVKSSAGSKLSYLGPWFFTVFCFILLSNISGLVYGTRPPTADWACTFAFALATFFLIQYAGLRYQGTKYLKSFIEPVVFFFPLNVIGELARPISLSFRLFGNLLAGMLLMTMLYEMTPIFLKFLVPVPLHIYFDLVAGILQTYVFCILSLSFIGAVAETE